MKIQDVLEIEFTVTLNGIMQSIAVKSRPGLLIVVCDKLCVHDNCLQTSEVTVLIVSMAISQSDNEKNQHRLLLSIVFTGKYSSLSSSV